MKVYDVMQLGTADIKALLKQTENKREKRKYRITFIVKNILCILFCMAVVVSFTVAFGADNGIPGVVVLLAILSMRQADLDIHKGQSVFVFMILFAILAIAPHLVNMLSPGPAFAVNLVSLFTIVVLSCHNHYLFNHATFVLGYLLLMGYDVSGDAYIKRVIGLMVGGAIVAAIFYIKHRKESFSYGIKDLLKDLLVLDERTRWQIKIALGISTALLLGGLIGIPRVMWVGFACMSLMSPITESFRMRFKFRMIGVFGGSLLFGLLYMVLPGDPLMYVGILGGLAVGFSGTYGWQTVFNCLGALSMTVHIFGLAGAIVLRIINNAIGILFSLCFHTLYERGARLLTSEKEMNPVELEDS